MGYHLPGLLSESDLPKAELGALVLDGQLYSVDEFYRPCDLPEFSSERARSLALSFGDLTFSHLSAAWVHGFVAQPPTVHNAYSRRYKNVMGPTRLHVREYTPQPAELCRYGLVQVSSPAATVIDLVRDQTTSPTRLSQLLIISRLDASVLLTLLERLPKRAGTAHARKLLRGASRTR